MHNPHPHRLFRSCRSFAHADSMAGIFTRMGIPSVSLNAGSSPEERRTVQRRLREREIRFIFVVDLYNEGVGISKRATVLVDKNGKVAWVQEHDKQRSNEDLLAAIRKLS